jgi:hypothetical protein
MDRSKLPLFTMAKNSIELQPETANLKVGTKEMK